MFGFFKCQMAYSEAILIICNSAFEHLVVRARSLNCWCLVNVLTFR